MISDGPVSQVKPRVAQLEARPPGRGALLDDGHVAARRPAAAAPREPAEAGADDDDPHRRCSPPSRRRVAAPATHVATRSWSITVPTASAARSACAASRNGARRPRRDGAERQALRDVDAVAQSARGDHRQAAAPPARASASASAVGHAPVGERARDARPARASRRPSISAQFVPPAPATSTAATPACASAATSAPESRPKPTSLTTTGRGASRATTRRDALEDAGEVRLALGLDRLLQRVEMDGSPSASSSSTSRSARAARAGRAPALRRGWPAAAAAASRRPGPVGVQQPPGPSSSRAARSEHERDAGARAAAASERAVDLLRPRPSRPSSPRSAAGRQAAAPARRVEPDVGERALGQRAVAQPHIVEPGRCAGVRRRLRRRSAAGRPCDRLSPR